MARLAGYVHVTDPEYGTEVFGPDSDVPAWAEKAITNPKAWAEPPAARDEDDAEGKGPTKADLEAEIARRNEGRDEADLIKPTGKNKADLIVALAADDQKS